jgi:hypothetical protein
MIAIQKVNKQASALSRNRFLSLLLLYLIYMWAIIHTYDFQIAEANAYAGMHPWEMTTTGWIYLTIVSLFLVFITSRLKGNPSDFFVIFYSAIPLISVCTLTSTSGKISESILLPSLAIIIFPLVSVFVVQYFFPKIKWRGIVSSMIVDKALLGILFLAIGYSYINSPESAGFDITSSYDRRLEGREIYTAGSLIAYALAMCMNGFAPYLAFRGAVNRQGVLIFVAFGAAVFFYWLLGVKAPIVYVILGCLVGYLTRMNYLRHFVKYFLIGIIGLYVLVLIEWSFFDDYSITADYGFRRLFSVQAEIQGYYLDFLMVNTPSFWNFLSGVHDQSFSAAYYVGNNYVGNPDSNANTNAFLYAFAANGILGYFVASFFVSIFLVLLDRFYRATQNPGHVLIGFVYGYLITEQAFSTAMVSSGVGLLFLLTFFEKYEFQDLNDFNRNVS